MHDRSHTSEVEMVIETVNYLALRVGILGGFTKLIYRYMCHGTVDHYNES